MGRTVHQLHWDWIRLPNVWINRHYRTGMLQSPLKYREIHNKRWYMDIGHWTGISVRLGLLTWWCVGVHFGILFRIRNIFIGFTTNRCGFHKLFVIFVTIVVSSCVTWNCSTSFQILFLFTIHFLWNIIFVFLNFSVNPYSIYEWFSSCSSFFIIVCHWTCANVPTRIEFFPNTFTHIYRSSQQMDRKCEHNMCL